MNDTWSTYYEASLNKPLHHVFQHAEPYLKAGGLAVDLGFGVGLGVQFFLSHGYRVLAVDSDPEAALHLRRRLPDDAEVECRIQDFNDFDCPPCDVVAALFSLFFLPPSQFLPVWKRLTRALKPGGVFMGQILGVNDDWAARGYSVFTKTEVEDLLQDFDITYFEEVDRDGITLLNEPKHWHIFHIVAIKR